MTQTELSLEDQYELVVKARKQVMETAVELAEGLTEMDCHVGDNGWSRLILKLNHRLGEIADDLYRRRIEKEVDLLLSNNE